MRLTRLEATTLGLLVDHPDHAYALQARLAPGLPRAARLNDGVLRPLLARLERRGLLTHTPGGRGRKTYHATPEGRTAFAAWLASDADEGDPLGTSLFLDQPFLKLLFDGHLRPEDRAATLKRIAGNAEERLAGLEALRSAPEISAAGRVLLDVGAARERAVLDGVERLR